MKTTFTSNVKTFADAAKAASKFTFQAFLMKKTKKVPPVVEKQPKSMLTIEIKGKEKPMKEESEDILVCSSSASAMPMQYEDFCNQLFVKDDERFTYETAQYVNSNNSEANEIGKSAKKVKGKRSSYRKSRSGMYKVDVQSSILELDDNEHHEEESVCTPCIKLDPIIETVARSEVTTYSRDVEQPKLLDIESLNAKVSDEIVNDVEEAKLSDEKVESKINVENVAEDDFYEIDGEKRNVKHYRELVVLETRLLNECSAMWDSCIHEAPEDGN